VIILALVAVHSQAKLASIGLLHPLVNMDGPLLLFPVKEGLSPEAALAEYVSELDRIGPECWGTLVTQGLDITTLCTHREFQEMIINNENVQMLVIANRIGHMCPTDPFPHVRQKLVGAGAKVHVLPIRLDLILDEEELRELRDFLMLRYDGMVAIGGADIHPDIYEADYGENGQYYKEIDEFEKALVGTWLDAKNGTMFGICRGHQLLSVLLGGTLIQDIASERPQNVTHTAPKTRSYQDQETSEKSSWHPISLVDSDNALYRAVGTKTFEVNSRHHQAVMIPDYDETQSNFMKNAKPIAFSGELVEAIELRNGVGFGVQFHPEDMDNGIGDAVMHMMVNMTKSFKEKRFTCRI